MKTAIDQNSLREGDIIAFREKIAGTDKVRAQYGIFVTNHYKDRDTVGFQIIPLTPYERKRRVPNGTDHLMVSAKHSISSMGLNPDVNWRIQYKFQIVPNTPRSLGIKDTGKIVKMGELDNRLHNTVFNYLERTLGTSNAPDTSALLGLGHSGPQGLRTDRTFERIGELGGVEKGRTVEGERRRQKAEETGADRNSKPVRKPKARKPISGRELNITLEDAEKLNLISKQTKEILERGNNRRAPKITTLKEAWKIASAKPEMLGSYFAPEEDMTYEKAYQAGKFDISDQAHAVFSVMIDKIQEQREDTKPLSWAQFSSFIKLHPESPKPLFPKGAHSSRSIDRLINSWEDVFYDDTSDAPKSTIEDVIADVNSGWNEFKDTFMTDRERYKDTQTMLPVNNL